MWVGAAPMQCPVKLLERPAVLRAEAGWEMVTESADRALERVDLYAGPPPAWGAQVPSASTRTGRVEVIRWDIAKGESLPMWLVCGYVGTTAVAAAPVPVGAQVCEARYALLASGRRLKVLGVECR
jgi:hypothetical protein